MLLPRSLPRLSSSSATTATASMLSAVRRRSWSRLGGCLPPRSACYILHGRSFATGATKKTKKQQGGLYFFRAGLPLLLFSGLGVWVVSNGLAGKNKERDAFQGRISLSERQAVMQREHDEVMEKIGKIVDQPFDNTKRIERPEEVLARRRKERERRNVWYRRWGRWIVGRKD